MFTKIMVPVDLAHVGSLARALSTAADLGKHYNCPVCYVGVTAETPTAQAHNPAEYADKLAAFAEAQAQSHGHRAEAKAFPSHDPSIDLNDVLLRAADETGADLIVIASHVPNLADHLWPSHGGRIAARAAVSVMVVR